MDGKEFLYLLRKTLGELADSSFLDNKTSYYYGHCAATAFVRRTHCLKNTQSITTVADQSDYTLNADFLEMYIKDDDLDYVIKYNDGTNNSFVKFKPYQEIVVGNNTTSQLIPSHFGILDDQTLDSQVTGTTTSAGASSLGQTTLTDTAADFSDVSAGDVVHNVTDGSDGIVISKTSSTVLKTALFGGTDNDWTNGDTYVVQPRGRMKIVLDPAPSTAAHTITVYYIQSPAPVYTDYGIYRFQQEYTLALVQYAAWLYKYKGKEPNTGDNWYKYWDAETRQAKASIDGTLKRTKFQVNFKKS